MHPRASRILITPLPHFVFLSCLPHHGQISALARTSQALSSSPPSEESLLYLEAARKAAEFLRGNLYRSSEEGGRTGTLLRSWRSGRASGVRCVDNSECNKQPAASGIRNSRFRYSCDTVGAGGGEGAEAGAAPSEGLSI